jgi:hypothetical protein
VVGQAIADIFGGPGEDAGLKYLANLHKIDLTTDGLITSTNHYAQAKELELKANEDLNNVWVKMTGTGSAMNVMYSSFKSSLASLLGTMAGVKDEAAEANEAFEDQAKKVIALDKSLVPLTEEYDNLKAKSKLTEAEQARLKTVIENIGKIVPTAVTEFDKYGNALDINSDKARQFVDTQKAMLKYRNMDVIEEETEKQKKLNKELTKINETLSNRNKQGDVVRTTTTFSKTDNVTISEVKLSDKEIANMQARAQEIEQLQLGIQASIDQHTGDYLTKFTEGETKKTEKTAEQIQARAAMEATAADLKIKNIEKLSDQELSVAIAKSIEKNNEIEGLTASQAEKAQKENEKFLESKNKLFQKSEEELAALLKKQQDERLLNSQTGIDKELLAIDQKYAALKEKFTLSEADKLNLTLEQITEREAQIQALEDEKALEKLDLKIVRDAEFREQLKVIEEENRILDEEAEFERQLAATTSDEERQLLMLDRARFIANQELEIEKNKELDKVKETENAEQLKAAIRDKYAKKSDKVNTEFANAEKALRTDQVLWTELTEDQKLNAIKSALNGAAAVFNKGSAAWKAIKIAETTITTYQSAVMAFNALAGIIPVGPALGAAAAAGAIASGIAQVNNISSTPLQKMPTYFYGGPTGDKEIYKDQFGAVTGVVHQDEWVAPAIMNDDPRYAPTIQWLESERQQIVGKFFNGGPTSANSPIAGGSQAATAASSAPNNAALIATLNQLQQLLNDGIKAYVVRDMEEYKRLKEIESDFDQILKNTRQ